MKLMDYFVSEMSDIVDKESKVTHEKLAEKVESQLETPTLWKGFQPLPGVRVCLCGEHLSS